jgi:hypothetical protein
MTSIVKLIAAGIVGLAALASPQIAEAKKSAPAASMGVRASTTGTAARDPNPVARDHRGGANSGGGVTVKDGNRRPKSPLCAGWFC